MAEMVRIHCFQQCLPEGKFNRPTVTLHRLDRNPFSFSVRLPVTDKVSRHNRCLPLLPPALAQEQLRVTQQFGAAPCSREAGVCPTAGGAVSPSKCRCRAGRWRGKSAGFGVGDALSAPAPYGASLLSLLN